MARAFFNGKRKRFTKSYGQNKKFSFKRGRPTWGSMYKATKKSTWAQKKSKPKSLGSQLGGVSSTLKKYRPKNSMSYKVGRALAAPTYTNTTFAFRHDSASNVQASVSQPFLNGVWSISGTTNGMTLNDIFTSSTLNNATRQLFVDSATLTMNITNISNVIVHITIRDIVSRRDWPNNAADWSPVTFWNNSSAESSGLGPAFNSTAIGAGPMSQVSDWPKQFKIDKTIVVRLNPGQVHKHTYSVKLNRKISYAEIHNGGAGFDLACMRGVTRFVMLTMYGSPCVSEAVGGNVAISPASIAVTGDFKSRFHFIQDTSKLVYKIANAINPLKTITDYMTVNDDDGAVQPVTSA